MAIEVFNELDEDNVPRIEDPKFLLQITEELVRNIPLFQAIVSEWQQPHANELYSPAWELDLWKQTLKELFGAAYGGIEMKVESKIAGLKMATRSRSEDTSTFKDECSNDQLPDLPQLAKNEQNRRNQELLDDVIHVMLLLRRYLRNFETAADTSPWG